MIHKTTAASIGAGTIVRANGDVVVQAVSSDDIKSISVGGSFGGTAAVTVNVSVPAITITTTATIGSNADIRAGGNVIVSADEAMTLYTIAGNISLGGTGAVGAGVTVPVVTKTTIALIDANARITSVYAVFDTLIPGGSELTGAENVRLDLGGHFRILGDRRTAAAVLRAADGD